MARENGSGSAVADQSELALRAERLAELDLAVERLLSAAAATGFDDVGPSGGWTARDVLGHITFWHESFARNVDDTVHARRPTPLRGRLADLNERGLVEARDVPPETIVDRLRAAHTTVRASILSPALGLIPYRIGSRPYTPREHLEVTRDHVRVHARSLERASATVIRRLRDGTD